MECFGEAAFTRRKVACNDLELIGGSESYQAVCRSCYIRSTPTMSPCEKLKAPPCSPAKQFSPSRVRNSKLSAAQLENNDPIQASLESLTMVARELFPAQTGDSQALVQ